MKPLILNYAVHRKSDVESAFEYDYEESINIITTEGRKLAYIDADKNNLSLLTKTKVNSESEDDQLSILELQTKTEVKPEADDDCLNYF